MSASILLVKPPTPPPLDEGYRPAVLGNRAFREAVRTSASAVPLKIALERSDGSISVYRTEVFAPGCGSDEANRRYVERTVKFLLWQRGGWKITLGGPREVGEQIQAAYAPQGIRQFDYEFMGQQVYEHPFTVEVTDIDQVPGEREASMPLGRHLNGCRIGFDLGASDRKVSAVVEGEVRFSEEVVWNPRDQANPRYHYHQIQSALHQAASFMPRVDAIGGSAAGVYINNRVMVASLFRGVPREVFNAQVKDLFLRIRNDWGGLPLELVNDGEVTALAGAMELEQEGQEGRKVLGIAMGSDEAGGYVNQDGNITGWLNELAFAPVDFNPQARVNEWSGDRGCGGEYFSQKAVIALAAEAGIELDPNQTPAEQLKAIQDLQARGDERASLIFETIGCYLGYTVAHYADFYPLRHVLILGRVTSGEGGNLILNRAREILQREFPELDAQITLHLPDESHRRVGQSIAAASLPVVE